jgi:hypothetical protein
LVSTENGGKKETSSGYANYLFLVYESTQIYGPMCDTGIWRIRRKKALSNLYQNVDTITDVKLRRNEWLRHLMRVENNTIPKMQN